MWWRKPAPINANVDQAWEAAITRCAATTVTYFPLIHPENDIPSEVLRELEQFYSEPRGGYKNDVVSLLQSIVIKGEPYEAQVRISDIRGAFHSKGASNFNLYKLPETMDLCDKAETGPESFGPLSGPQIDRLNNDLHSAGSGIYDNQSRMRLDYQTWDNCYIVGNKHSHSRRVALWCRLQNYHGKVNGAPTPQVYVSAIVQPISLDENLIDALNARYRLVFLQEDSEVADAVACVSALNSDVAYFPAPAVNRPAMIALPLLGSELAIQTKGLVVLHRWLDSLFDLGRYLSERRATYNLKHG